MPASVYKGTIRMYSSYFFKGCDNMIEIGINKITKRSEEEEPALKTNFENIWK